MARRKYTKELLEDLVRKSKSYAEIIRRLGMKQTGGTQGLIKKRVEEYEIDTSHFTGKAHARGKHDPKRRSAAEVLVYRDRSTFRQDREPAFRLRRALIEIGRQYACENEGCTVGKTWLSKTLVLNVDHINGDPRDCRPENLRFLCPNCHSQTSNFSGTKGKTSICERRQMYECIGCGREIHKNKSGLCHDCYWNQEHRRKNNRRPTSKRRRPRKVENRPDEESLKKMISEMSWCAIGRKYGVSDNAVRKWAKAYKII